jgi:hypothetical protein
MLSVVADAATRAAMQVDLDELVGEGARRILAAALEAEVDDYLAAYAAEWDEGVGGWWSATAMPASVRSRPRPGASRSARPGWRTAGSTR